jgi:hypothetical protein
MSPNPSSLEYLKSVTSAYLDTDKVSEKRFSNMQKNLNREKRGPSLVGYSNGDSSSCSGNENELRIATMRCTTIAWLRVTKSS